MVGAVGEMDGFEEHAAELLYRAVLALIAFVETAAGEGQKRRLRGPGLNAATGLAVVEVGRAVKGTVPVAENPAG